MFYILLINIFFANEPAWLSDSTYHKDSILINDTISTEEIKVEAGKNFIEFSQDKTIFNISDKPIYKGTNAIDVLRSLPFVTVDGEGNVFLKGNKTPKIWIDGRPSQIFSDLKNLRTLSSDQIERIEIITNPSAKYEAESAAGIINIILKKEKLFGINGNLNLNAGTKKKYNLYSEVNVKKDLYNFFSGYSFSSDHNNRFEARTARENFLNDTNHFSNTLSNNLSIYDIHYLRGGIEYNISQEQYISLSGNLNSGKSNFTGNWRNNSYNIFNDLVSGFNSSSNAGSNNKGYSLNLYYEKKLSKPGSEITGDIGFSNYNSENNTEFLTDIVFNQGSVFIPPGQKNFYKSIYKNIDSRIDLTYKFNEMFGIESGLRTKFKTEDNKSEADTLETSSGNFIKDFSGSYNFDYREWIHSGYAILGFEKGELNLKIGLRTEQTFTRGILNSYDVSKKDYISIFPSVNINKRFGSSNMLQFSYSRRINRPFTFYLNPFNSSRDPRFINRGNPDLDPEFINSLELGLLTFLNAVTITPSIFYKKTSGLITRVSSVTGDGVTVSTFTNFSSSENYGIDILSGLNLSGWLRFNGSVSYYKIDFHDNSFSVSSDILANEGFSWNAKANAFLTFPSFLIFELMYNYQGNRISPQRKILPTHILDIGISKSFLDYALNLSLKISDVLNQRKYDSEIWGAGFYQTYTSKFDSRIISLNLNYTFGKIESPKKRKKPDDDIMQDSVPEGELK
jgi:iron complex outermembrane recepter protein